MANKAMTTAFGMNPLQSNVSFDFTETPSTTRLEDLENDYLATRTTLHQAMAIARQALKLATELVANEGIDDPKMFDSISHLVAAMTKAASDLMAMQEKLYKMEEASQKSKDMPKKDIFIEGTIEDLRKLIAANRQ